MSSPPVHIAAQADPVSEHQISYFMQQAVENPKLISLAAGLVDAESLPAAEVAVAVADLLSTPQSARRRCNTARPRGWPRSATGSSHVPRHSTASCQAMFPWRPRMSSSPLAHSNFSTLPVNCCLIPAPSLSLERLLLRLPGDSGSPGARTLSVPMDEDGMNIDALAELLARLERTGELDRLRLIYACDYFQNPSGLTLSLPRRQRLLELVQRYSRRQRILILEDAAYRELRYEGRDLPSIKSFDSRNEYVISTMTFSKACAPGLKTGYSFLPRELVGPLLRLKDNHDFGSNNFTQHLLDRLLDTGAYDRHVAYLCQVYRGKRDALLSALSHEFCGWPAVRWTHPAGGLYVWLTFPPGMDTGPRSLLMQAALHEGVLYIPGQFCYVGGAGQRVPTNEARLSFGVVALEKIREGVRRLARAAGSVGVTSSS